VPAQAVKEALQVHDIEMPTEIYTLLLKDVPDTLKSSNKTRDSGNSASASSASEIAQTGTLTEL